MLNINVLRGRIARGGHGFPKASLGPDMPDPSTPCGRATPETAGTEETACCRTVVRLGALSSIISVSEVKVMSH
jgi:hypothetical protein